jgi:hypothetical protein
MGIVLRLEQAIRSIPVYYDLRKERALEFNCKKD